MAGVGWQPTPEGFREARYDANTGVQLDQRTPAEIKAAQEKVLADREAAMKRYDARIQARQKELVKRAAGIRDEPEPEPERAFDSLTSCFNSSVRSRNSFTDAAHWANNWPCVEVPRKREGSDRRPHSTPRRSKLPKLSPSGCPRRKRKTRTTSRGLSGEAAESVIENDPEDELATPDRGT